MLQRGKERSERKVGEEAKEGEGGWSSVVGVGVIVGDGAEKESVLRPACLPSGEKLFQHPLKWPALDKILCRVVR